MYKGKFCQIQILYSEVGSIYCICVWNLYTVYMYETKKHNTVNNKDDGNKETQHLLFFLRKWKLTIKEVVLILWFGFYE